MTKEQKKYYIIGGIMLAAITFLSFKAFSKTKKKDEPKEKPKKPKTSIIVGDPVGGFTLPAEVTTRVGTRLRQSSSTDSAIVYTYQTPTKLLVRGDSMESDGQWFEVYDQNGRSGWVRSDVVDFEPTGMESTGYEYQYDEQAYWDYLAQIHG